MTNEFKFEQDVPSGGVANATVALKGIQSEIAEFKNEVRTELAENAESMQLEMTKLKNEVRTELAQSTKMTIMVLGVFVALFTFVSVEIQIFKSFTTWKAGAAFTFTLLGALSLFLAALTYTINDPRASKVRNSLFPVALACLFVGILFFAGAGITVQENHYVTETELADKLHEKELEIQRLETEIYKARSIDAPTIYLPAEN